MRVILLTFILLLISTPIMGADYFIHIPQQYRQQNLRASCVHASVTNCLRSANLWTEAEQFWNRYKGSRSGDNPHGISRKLDEFNIKYKIVRDEQSLLNALKMGRCVAVTWGGAHMVNLVGKVDNNAYIVDNENIHRYSIQPWTKFMSSFRRSGGWAVVILSGKPRKPIEKKDLRGVDIEKSWSN